MNTKAITATIVLAAVTVALNPALSGIGIPAPYAPFLIYQIWEIPIVTAFLLLGAKYGLAISALNSMVLLAIFPGALLMGPFYNLIAIVSMLLGIYMVHRLLDNRTTRDQTSDYVLKHKTKLVSLSTALGIILRVGAMTAVNYAVLRYSAPLGYSLPEEAILGSLPLIAVFNATLALYTIPLGHLIADAVRSNLRFR
jgi:riboflavin transporter FmnP